MGQTAGVKKEVEVVMPRLGESVTEATITKWLKKEGDPVEIDEPIVEIATDKVDSDVPSPVKGILKKRLYKEGDIVQVGKPFAIIEVEATEEESMDTHQPEQPVEASEPQPEPEAQATDGEVSAQESRAQFFSPVVLRIAREHGISMEELSKIKGTGLGGRVTKKDILRYVEERKRQKKTEEPAVAQEQQATIPATLIEEPQPLQESVSIKQIKPGEEIIEMDRVRQLIAEHMVRSKRISPHVTSFAEADVTGIVEWREKWKEEFKRREGFNLTYTPIFVELLVQALKEFPLLNASVDGTRIIVKKYYNIGIAVALPDGNLIVPVVKNADQYNLVGLARAIYDLANRARNKQLKPDEIEGGTFTLTNIGSFGSLMGTPIINQPQVAILATGAIKKRVVVVETPHGDAIAIRHIMYLSLSYDHRIIDGALAGAFLKRYVELLENFDTARTI